jgi:uncharacterized protein
MKATLTSDRERDVLRLIEDLAVWARRRGNVRGVALVGSWARGSARMDSDVDVILLTDEPAEYIESEQWAHELGAKAITRTQVWGVLTERRLALRGGLEVEVGVVSPSWACVAPLDEGTAQVLAGGLIPLHDPDGLLAALLRAVAPAADALEERPT